MQLILEKLFDRNIEKVLHQANTLFIQFSNVTGRHWFELNWNLNNKTNLKIFCGSIDNWQMLRGKMSNDALEKFSALIKIFISSISAFIFFPSLHFQQYYYTEYIHLFYCQYYQIYQYLFVCLHQIIIIAFIERYNKKIIRPDRKHYFSNIWYLRSSYIQPPDFDSLKNPASSKHYIQVWKSCTQ